MTLDAVFHRAIRDHVTVRRLSARAFGAAVLGDTAFLSTLQKGRSVRLRTADRVLAHIGMPPIGPGFLCEVEAFLAITGVKASVLGFETTGSPSFVNRLRRGLSPRLKTVTSVWRWMAQNSTLEEAATIRNSVGPQWIDRMATAPTIREHALEQWQDRPRDHLPEHRQGYTTERPWQQPLQQSGDQRMTGEGRRQ